MQITAADLWEEQGMDVGERDPRKPSLTDAAAENVHTENGTCGQGSGDALSAAPQAPQPVLESRPTGSGRRKYFEEKEHKFNQIIV